MRKRKLIVIALLSAFGMSAKAQIVSSQSNQVIVTEQVKVKKPSSIKCYIKIGPSYDICSFDDATDSNLGYELALGLKQPIGKQGTFWGIEAGGISNRYLKYHSHSEYETSFSLFGTPYIGYEFETGIAPYIGPFVCYGTENLSNANWRAGFSIGANYWVSKNIAFGLNYKADLLDDTTGTLHKITLSLYFAF